MFPLASNTNVLSKSSYNRKCSAAVLCCCTLRMPLLQRLKSQGRCPSTCFLAAKKVKSFCSVKLLCIPGSVTQDSHQTVCDVIHGSIQWAVWEAKANRLCRSSCVLCPRLLPIDKGDFFLAIYFFWRVGENSSVCKTMQWRAIYMLIYAAVFYTEWSLIISSCYKNFSQKRLNHRR